MRFIVHRPSSTVYRPSSIVYSLPSIVHRPSSIVYRLPSTVHRLPSTVYRPRPPSTRSVRGLSRLRSRQAPTAPAGKFSCEATNTADCPQPTGFLSTVHPPPSTVLCPLSSASPLSTGPPVLIPHRTLWQRLFVSPRSLHRLELGHRRPHDVRPKGLDAVEGGQAVRRLRFLIV